MGEAADGRRSTLGECPDGARACEVGGLKCKCPSWGDWGFLLARASRVVEDSCQFCFALFSPPPLLFETVTRLYVLLQQKQQTHTHTPPLLLPTYLLHSLHISAVAAAAGVVDGPCLRARWGGDLTAGAEGQGSSYRKVKQVLSSFLFSLLHFSSGPEHGLPCPMLPGSVVGAWVVATLGPNFSIGSNLPLLPSPALASFSRFWQHSLTLQSPQQLKNGKGQASR